MLCKSLIDYTSILLMRSELFLEIRSIPQIDSMHVTDIIRKPYTVMNKVRVSINEALEVLLPQKLEVTFEDNTMFYAAFHNAELDLTIIPEWFTEVMIGTKSQTFSIDNHNQQGNKILMTVPEVVEFNKFDMLVEG